MTLLAWYNICFAYNSQTDMAMAVLNGQVIYNKTNNGLVELPRSLTKGGYYLGCSSRSDPFHGEITDIQV
jgi:hypothetical protein